MFNHGMLSLIELSLPAVRLRVRPRASRIGAVEDNGLSATDNEFLAYWRAHNDKWAPALRMLDEKYTIKKSFVGKNN